MYIVDRIKELCKSQNTTLKALERELKLSNGSIRNWDNSKPSVEKVRLVAEKFNVSLDWLITGKESEDLTPEERKLVDTYRNCNPVGQQLIQDHAEAIHKQLPANHCTDEAGVSISETG